MPAAGIARVSVIFDHVRFSACDFDLLGVEHNHKVAGIDMRRIRRLGLALEDHRDFRREASEHLVARIDDVPVGLDLARLGRIGAHLNQSFGVLRSDEKPRGSSIARRGRRGRRSLVTGDKLSSDGGLRQFSHKLSRSLLSWRPRAS